MGSYRATRAPAGRATVTRSPSQIFLLLQMFAALPSTSPWTFPGYKQYRAIPSRLNPPPGQWKRQEQQQAPQLPCLPTPAENWEEQLSNGRFGSGWHFSSAVIIPGAAPIMHRGMAWVGGVNRAAGASLAGLGRYGLLALTPPPAVMQMGAMGIVGHYFALVIGGWGIYQVLRGIVRAVFPWRRRLRHNVLPTGLPAVGEAEHVGETEDEQAVVTVRATSPSARDSDARKAPVVQQQSVAVSSTTVVVAEDSKPVKAKLFQKKAQAKKQKAQDKSSVDTAPVASGVAAVVTGEGRVMEVQRSANPTMVLAFVLLLFYALGMLAVRSRRRLMQGQDEEAEPASVGASQEEAKRRKGRRVTKSPDGAPVDLRGELEGRGLLSSLKKQQQDLDVLQDIYKRGGFYAPVLIEATGEKVALIKYLETALHSFHDTWQQVMAVADEFKFRSVGADPRFQYSVMVPYDDSLQVERIESLELMLQHLPKVRPVWWQWADKTKIKAHDNLVAELKKELACRRFFRSQFKEFEQTLELPSLGLQ